MPLLAEFDLVRRHHRNRLIIAAGACGFVMEDAGGGLIDHSEAVLPESHAIVGVFVVGGCELFSESSKFAKQARWRDEKNTRAILDRTAEIVLRQSGIISASVTQSAAVRPDD